MTEAPSVHDRRRRSRRRCRRSPSEAFTVTLTDLGDKTQVVYQQTGHLPAEQYALIEDGVSGFYDRFAEHAAWC